MRPTTATKPAGARGIIRAIMRLILASLWIAAWIPVFVAIKCIGINAPPARLKVYRGLCWLLGLRVVIHGVPAKERPLLIASNHISWLDVLAFGAATELEFVSKAEVSSWPIIGMIARLADTVFVDRRRLSVLAARDKISEGLATNRSLIFFPESTSGDGNRLLPFKSSLFNVVNSIGDGKVVTVQPAAIAYTKLNGLPTGSGWRSFFAWYGDMTLMSHMWRFLQLGRTTVEIVFLQPIVVDGVVDRKRLATRTEAAANAGFNGLLSGRLPF